MGHIEPGHPYVEDKNHASSGVHKSMELGGGGKFAALSKKVGSPALAAFIGRKKYGAKKMSMMASAHR